MASDNQSAFTKLTPEKKTRMAKELSESEAPAVRIRPPLVYLLVFGLGVLFQLAISFRIFSEFRLGHLAGWPVILSGAALVLWAEKTMSRNGVVPSFKPVPTIVTTGPFAFSRNPMYLGMTLMYVGLGLVLNTFWPLLFLPAVLLILHYGVIFPEEVYLQNMFDEEYRQYCTRVRRWL